MDAVPTSSDRQPNSWGLRAVEWTSLVVERQVSSPRPLQNWEKRDTKEPVTLSARFTVCCCPCRVGYLSKSTRVPTVPGREV
jgi:hypothetical protein